MQFKFKQIVFMVLQRVLQNIIGVVKNITRTNLVNKILALVLSIIVLSIDLSFGQSLTLAADKQFIRANKRFYRYENYENNESYENFNISADVKVLDDIKASDDYSSDNFYTSDNELNTKERFLSTTSLRSLRSEYKKAYKNAYIKAYIKVSLSMGTKQIISICREARSKGLEQDFSFIFVSSIPNLSLIHSLASNGCSFVIGVGENFNGNSNMELSHNTTTMVPTLVPDVINIETNESLCEGYGYSISILCKLLVSPYGSSIRNNWEAETIGSLSTNLYSEFAIKKSYSDYGSSINRAVFQKRLNSSRSNIIRKLQEGYQPVLNSSIQ